MSLSCFALAQEKPLIEHVVDCIEKGERECSSLSSPILAIDGMSSAKIRHFLNNLCSLPGASYLEIGCWKGSTLISALYHNSSIVQAVAIDNWSEFGGPREDFLSHLEQFLPGHSIQILETDCFSVDKKAVFSRPVNIYFYDGNHEAMNQERAFTYFNDILDELFIAVVDDWNTKKVREGTRAAFYKLHYKVLYEKEIFTEKNADTESWWNGFYIAVITKGSQVRSEKPVQR